MRNSGNVKIFYNKAQQENIYTNIWLKVILQYCPELWLVEAIFGSFYLVLAYSTILVIIFQNLTMFQYRPDSPQVKRNVISCIANLVYELPHELPNDLRLKTLGNKEILRKSQIWVQTQPSAQSPFQKLNFGNSSPKTRKSRYQTFLVLSSFTGFLCFVPNILSEIVAFCGLLWVVPHFVKKMKAHQACQKSETLKKVKARKVRKKMKAREKQRHEDTQAWKVLEHVRHVGK